MIDWLSSLFPSGWIGQDEQSILITCVAVTACVVVIYAIDSVVSIFRDLFRRKGG